jgi:hypothetical protein
VAKIIWENPSAAVKDTEKDPDIKKEKAVANFPQGNVQKHDGG